MGIGLLPTDFLAYAAFARQVGDRGAFLFVNPFTTEPQEPRFVLLFHWVLGAVAGLFGVSPLWILELSRIPLTFAFFFVLWRFTAVFLTRREDRLWACALVAFSGGLEGFVRFLDGLPEALTFQQDTWTLQGWNFFAAAYNPLWICALTLTLIALKDVMTQSPRLTLGQALKLGLGIVVLQTVHPYSAIVVVAVCIGLLVFNWASGAKFEPGWDGRFLLGVGVGVGLVGLLLWWQSLEPAFKASADRTFGNHELPVFWYPVTLGMTGLLALRGACRDWSLDAPRRRVLLAWVAVVALLHSSPILNGYKFVLHLYVPVCLLAAPVARQVYQRFCGSGLVAKTGAALMLALAFGSSLMVTVESMARIGAINEVSASYMRVVRAISSRPAGNVLAPVDLGNLIPAFAPHRVWLGHWFLTPDFRNRWGTYERLTTSPHAKDELLALLDQQRLRYLVLATDRAERVARLLAGRIVERVPLGDYELWELRSPPRQ
jgi:hypothetical protein